MVYLIHLDTPLAHAQHYLGFVKNNLEQRVKRHRSGQGAKMLKAANEAGIGWDVVRTWPDGDRTFERMLKNRKKSKCLCPKCSAKKTKDK